MPWRAQHEEVRGVWKGGAVEIVRSLGSVAHCEFLMDESGQDLIEYALMGGVVAVAAATVIPPMAPSVSAIFSKAISVLEKFS